MCYDIHKKGYSKGEEKCTIKTQLMLKKHDAEKYQRALDLFTESVLKPDHDLRGCAYNQGCYDDFMEIRKHVLEYLKH